jgi:hypothetical protein
MSMISSLVLVGLLLAPSSAAQQLDPPPAVTRKRGTIYKSQVDGLIGALRATARRGEAGAAGDGVLGRSGGAAVARLPAEEPEVGRRVRRRDRNALGGRRHDGARPRRPR